MATQVERLADFAVKASYQDLSSDAKNHLKLHILDSLGCAIGALQGEPIKALRAQADEFGGKVLCTLIGGMKNAPDWAACYNTALVRYLDFMDNFLAKKETCHPCDNLGSVLAAADYNNLSGRDFMAALALAYQVQCRLLEDGPITQQGFDHTTQLSLSIAAGVSRALGLTYEQTANAIAICGSCNITLWVNRIGKIPQWKGLLSSHVAKGCMHDVFLARRGITGQLRLFEEHDGYEQSLRSKFDIDWDKEYLDKVTHTAIKPYNAEVHMQVAIEASLDLKRIYGFEAQDIENIEIEIFKTAYNIVGGGEGGDKKDVQTKEQADHSMPYAVAVALLDGQVLPAQYAPDRINRGDVQNLLRKVTVRPKSSYTRNYPDKVMCKVIIHLKDSRKLEHEKYDFKGFYTRPMSWDDVVSKFEMLSEPYTDSKQRNEIIAAVNNLDNISIRDLMHVLEQAKVGSHEVISI
jgi:2-methylcitrate dehydratase